MIKGLRIFVTLFLIVVLFSSSSKNSGGEPVILVEENSVHALWNLYELQENLSFDIFDKAITGMHQLSAIKNRNQIVIIDYTKPSTEERFFVLDLLEGKVLYKSLVAHGRNSGANLATTFSNKPGSLQSSLGFFVTAETYQGKHGFSLRLDGLEKNINDAARERAIVIHAADYVCNAFVTAQGRLGRSWGCPALPNVISKEVINTIADGTCIFIYGKDATYFDQSKIL